MSAAQTFTYPPCRLMAGSQEALDAAMARFAQIEPDDVRLAESSGWSPKRTTLGRAEPVAGVGTFSGRERRTITFAPSSRPGWWIRRTDQPEQLDTSVDIANLWTSARNLVLRSGSPHNYLRMVEHIVALKGGLGLDNVVIETNSGDPPLFDESSSPLVDAVRRAGIVETGDDATYITVREPLAFSCRRGSFLLFLPDDGSRRLRLDVAISWNTVIGDQRVVFDVTPETFAHGAFARTNATHRQYLLAKTVGLLFADTRNLGYNKKNILIHGRRALPRRKAGQVPRAGVAPRHSRPAGRALPHGRRQVRGHGGELPRRPHGGLRRSPHALQKRPACPYMKRSTIHSRLFARARRVIPGGVNSPVRAFNGVGGVPIFVESGSGARVRTADGRLLDDYCCSWGAMILGHAREEVVEATARAAAGGSTF